VSNSHATSSVYLSVQNKGGRPAPKQSNRSPGNSAESSECAETWVEVPPSLVEGPPVPNSSNGPIPRLPLRAPQLPEKCNQTQPHATKSRQSPTPSSHPASILHLPFSILVFSPPPPSPTAFLPNEPVHSPQPKPPQPFTSKLRRAQTAKSQVPTQFSPFAPPRSPPLSQSAKQTHPPFRQSPNTPAVPPSPYSRPFASIRGSSLTSFLPPYPAFIFHKNGISPPPSETVRRAKLSGGPKPPPPEGALS
jgi:hypothetical protein